jgi:predicted ribosome quality control (RQC) complex YloA/Tae2 family protein
MAGVKASRGFSSLDVHFMVKELKDFILGSKLVKAYSIQKQGSFLLRMHNPKHKKQDFVFSVPSLFFRATLDYDKPQKPSSFVMLLRKVLSGAGAASFSQLGFERAAVMEFQRESLFRLYFEFLPPGNVVLCDSEDRIIQPWHSEEFSTRKVKKGEKYSFPRREDPLLFSEEEFFSAIKNSERESLVKALAVALGLGGFYAETLCAWSGLDKNLALAEFDRSASNAVFSAFRQLLESELRGFSSEKVPFSPVPFLGHDESRQAETFSEVVERCFSSQFEFAEKAEVEKEKSKTRKILDSQAKILASAEREHAECKIQGEAIYENYQQLSQLASRANELKKQVKDWKKVEEILRQEGNKVSIEPKTGKLIVEL